MRFVRSTDFVNFLQKGGLSERAAACIERWIDDKRPAGISPERLLEVCLVANAAFANEVIDDRAALLEQIDKLEQACDLFGVRYGMPR